LVSFLVPIVIASVIGDLVVPGLKNPDAYQGWVAFLRYFVIFVFGWLLHHDQRLVNAVRRSWLWLLLVDIAGAGGYAVISMSGEPSSPARCLVQGAFAATMEWCLALALLPPGKALLDRGGYALHYCLSIVVPFYVLHGPALATVDYWIIADGILDWLSPMDDPGRVTNIPMLSLAGTTITLALLLAVIEISVRPIPPLRFLLGVPKERIPV
jgi:hypothetical protein